MKKVLITGKNSYIGNALENWLAKEPENYQVESIDMKDGSWKERDFSSYDVVFHVAGIAHVSTDPKMEELYYKVNRDLTIETAEKAKAEGVKQFIFMSSIIVYGDSSSSKRVIDRKTIPTPSNFYGNSKLQAEEGIKNLESDEFKIVILRPPMIYGKGSKGNYPLLAKFARCSPIFPNIINQRSMIHIDNLTQFIRVMIDYEENGIFFPQNKKYINTSDMVKIIAEVNGRKLLLTSIFNPGLIILGKYLSVINKVFGSLVYDKSISDYNHDYCVNDDLEKTIRLTE